MTTRITHQTIAANALANLQQSLSVTQKLSDRRVGVHISTVPSDDPAGTVSALQIREDSRAQQQYSRSAADGLGWLGAADGALNTAIASLRRAQELTLRGANTGANGPDARAAMAVEIRQIRDAMLEVANTTYLGRPVFGGTTKEAQAFDDGSYIGDHGTVVRSLGPNTNIRVDTDGQEAFGRADATVFKLLDDIALHLEEDTPKLQEDLADLSGVLGEFTSALADVGARYARVESLG